MAVAEGRREWTIVGDRFGPTEVLEGPVLPHDVQVRVVEVGVSPEEERGSGSWEGTVPEGEVLDEPVVKPRNNDGCEWCGRFGLSREEIEALLGWYHDLNDLLPDPDPTPVEESAVAKLRAYLGQQDDV